jgi:type I restriction enzyme S subunit
MSWEERTWEDIVVIKNGKNQKKVINPKGRYPIYGSGGVIGYADDFICEAGSTIIGRKGSINNPIFVDEKYWNVDTAFGLHPKKGLDNKFFYYFCTTYDFLKHNKTVTIPSLTKSDLLKIKIPLPPLEQQKKIAAILDAADAYRQKTKALIAKYDELTQSLFLDMFGDPVKNEKGWEKKEFKEYILEVKNGITRRPKSEEDNSGDKVLKLKHIRSNYINYDCENRIMLEESEKQKFVVEIGDLLFIRVNGNPDYVGRCALHNDINQEVYYNDHIMRVRYNFNYYNGLFLSQYLNYPYGQSEISKQIKTSAGQHTINQGGLEKLNLIIPPIQLQNKFAERVQAIEVQKAQAQVSLEKAEELFNGLLQRAFKGELV